jgi:formate hydrogenlyase transcriptional activator
MKKFSSGDGDNLIHQLRKRIRELECIHDIFNIVANLDTPFDQILQDITKTVPNGFYFPETTCALINVADKVATTSNFQSPSEKLEAYIHINNKPAGKLEIGYIDTIPQDDEKLFDHEKKFLQVLADQIGMVLTCKTMKDALQESERKYRNVLENSLVGIYRINLTYGIVYANPACLRMFGFKDLEEARAKDFSALFKNGEDRKNILNILEQTGSLQNIELEMVTHTGKPIVVLLNAVLESDSITGMMMDITERKQADEALIRNEKRLVEAQRIARVGWWEWDILTGKMDWSDEVYRIFGLLPDKFDLTPQAFFSVVHPYDRQAVQEAVDLSLTDPGKPLAIEHRIVCPDGNDRVVYGRGEVTFDKDRRPVRMVGTIQDITSVKRTEKELQNAFDEIGKLKDKLEAENIYLREEMDPNHKHKDIIGESDPIKYVIHRVGQVAQTKTTVLLTGETGVGKGKIAHFIHRESDRRHKSFIQVNCAGLPANLIESELFGREKGAFTGSNARQIGRFELADKGTIFLDEIGELPMELQAKLLKVIEDEAFERLGSPHTVNVDVRIIACTNRNLEEEIKNGRFRQDLFFRINVFPITIPPLRQRREDIPLFVSHLINKFNKEFGKKIKSIPRKTMKLLEEYCWPGNVRELINVIERAAIVSTGSELRLAERIDAEPVGSPMENIISDVEASASEPKCLLDVERDHILRTLQKTGWRIDGPQGAAKILQINPSTLRGRMRKLGIKKPGN